MCYINHTLIIINNSNNLRLLLFEDKMMNIPCMATREISFQDDCYIAIVTINFHSLSGGPGVQSFPLC